jgi:U3 small nucleolar RNA-associated protein MPP10
MENSMVDKKPWQLRGEITAKSRPMNSLLQETLDFKVTTRPKPLPTPERNKEIEKIIKSRISNDLFDDPKRFQAVNSKSSKGNKSSTNNNDNVVSEPEININFDKSRKGLAELYEEDFNNESNKNSKEPKTADQIEIESMMEDLFTMFSGLTNNNFIGERVKSEMNVIKNVKSIRLEDVSKNIFSEKTLGEKSKDERIVNSVKAYNPSKVEVVTKEELSSHDLRQKHRQMKRKVHKKIYERNLKKKMSELSEHYDSKYEVRLALKAAKDKMMKAETSKDNKANKFFKNLQERRDNKSLKDNSKDVKESRDGKSHKNDVIVRSSSNKS